MNYYVYFILLNTQAIMLIIAKVKKQIFKIDQSCCLLRYWIWITWSRFPSSFSRIIFLLKSCELFSSQKTIAIRSSTETETVFKMSSELDWCWRGWSSLDPNPKTFAKTISRNETGKRTKMIFSFLLELHIVDTFFSPQM